MRSLLLFSVALAAGCSSNFKLKMDDDRFGAKKGLWLELKQSYDGSTDTSHALVATDVSGACGKLQKAYTELSTLTEAFYEAYDENETSEEYCARQKQLYLDIADAVNPIYGGGVTTASFSFYDGSDSDGAPPEGSFTRDPDAYYDYNDPEPTFYGSFSALDTNIYEEYGNLIDCADEDYAWYDEAQEIWDRQKSYYVTEGTAEVSKKGDSKYKLTASGKYEDDDEDSGDFEAKGTFKHCLVEYEGYAYLYL